MLEALRSFVGSWAAKILLVLLVGSFALWGISGSLLGQGDVNTVATIGETKVPARDFVAAYQRNLGQIQQQTRQRLTREQARTFGVEARAFSDVVAFGTLDEYARRSGLSLSEDSLVRMIGENPQFQDSTGTFNRDTFRRAVYEAQMREADFVDAQNASAIRSQITRGFATGEVLPDVFAQALGEFSNETRVIDYVTVTPTAVGIVARPDDSTLQAWFEERKADYAAPEYRKLTLLQINPELIADEKAVSADQVAADYEARRANYEVPEKRRVQQVVFVDREAADALAAKVAEGELFDTAITDAGLTSNDLGLVAQGEVPNAIGEAEFALELNGVSPVIDGPFGPTLVRGTEIAQPRTTPLAEVEADIRRDLALRTAADRVNDLYEAIEDSRAGGASLPEIASKLDLDVRTIENVDRTGRDASGAVIGDIPSSPTLLARAFEAQIGQQGSPIDGDQGGYTWVDVDEITPTRDRAFAEVADRVAQDWISAERARLVAEKADAIAAGLKEGATMAALAADNGLSVVTTQPLKRNAQGDAFPRSAVEAAFNGGPDVVFVAEGITAPERIVGKVTAVAGDETPPPAETMELANEGAANDLLNQFIGNLQSEYAVTRNDAVIDAALTRAN